MNKYECWYYELMDRAREPRTLLFPEIHHIIPKSIGGDNDPDNLVRLSLREHFLAHWLLTKFVEKDELRSMLLAFNGMGGRYSSGWRYERSKQALRRMRGLKVNEATCRKMSIGQRIRYKEKSFYDFVQKLKKEGRLEVGRGYTPLIVRFRKSQARKKFLKEQEKVSSKLGVV